LKFFHNPNDQIGEGKKQFFSSHLEIKNISPNSQLKVMIGQASERQITSEPISN